MTYISTGAYVSGVRPASKAALKRALAVNPETVTFDVTGLNGPRAGGTIKANAADIGAYLLSVTGPDPYLRHSWYGTVKVTSNGKVTCT